MVIPFNNTNSKATNNINGGPKVTLAKSIISSGINIINSNYNFIKTALIKTIAVTLAI